MKIDIEVKSECRLLYEHEAASECVCVRSGGRVPVLDGRGIGHGHAHDVAGAHAGLHGLLATGAALRPTAAALRRGYGLRPHAPGPVTLGHPRPP